MEIYSKKRQPSWERESWMELGKKSIEMCTVLSVCNRHDMMMMIISLEYE